MSTATRHIFRKRFDMRYLLNKRWLQYLLLASAMVLLACGLQHHHWRWADALENLLLDTSFRMRAPQTPAAVAESLPATRDIVLIELPHPVPRPLLAQLAVTLRQADAVAFDMMFVDQRAELSPVERPWYAANIQSWDNDERVLSSAFTRSGNVIVGAWKDETWVKHHSRKGEFTRERSWRLPVAPIWESARYHAHVLVHPDRQDHIVRRAPLFQDIQVTTPSDPLDWDGETPQAATTVMRVPCLGLAMAAAAKRISPTQLTTQLQHLSPHGGYLRLGDSIIPYDHEGMTIIDYVGGRQCFEYGTNRVVYDRVLRLYRPEDFAGKLVMIGSSDIKSNDCYPTPYGLMTGLQIHANIAATLIGSPQYVRQMPRWGIACLALLCSLLTILSLVRWPLWVSLLATCSDIVLVMLAAAWWFNHTRSVAFASIPILAILFTYTATILFEFSRTRFALMKFIGPAMLKRVLYQIAHLRLGVGNTEEASAMFCDLRGFTTLTEALPPAALAQILNEYTDTIVTIAGKYHGRPIDFAGDGIFLLFERSLAGHDFPLQAVNTAREIHQKLIRHPADTGTTDLSHLDLGIAVHTGPMMIGILGSEHFLKMGAVGDVVNVAARVQGLSIACGFDVLITQETYQRLPQEALVAYCGSFTVRGRKQPVEVYGLAETRRDVSIVPVNQINE